MNTISASLRLTHFHLHHGGDDHDHAHVYDHVRVYGRVHVYAHGYVRDHAHRLHDNAHDELYLKAV